MRVGLLGRKVGMTQIYQEDGTVVPVTVLECGPCSVLQVRTPERDGYHAIQLGFLDKKRRNATQAERGHAKKADAEPKRFIREFRLSEAATQKVGDNLLVDLFESIKAVDVTGMTKGRGTTGVMKAHNYQGMGASHGVQICHRAPGSVGSHATDRGHSGKIKKGKKMATRWGNERVTIRNLKVVRVDLENNLLLVRGAVPGTQPPRRSNLPLAIGWLAPSRSRIPFSSSIPGTGCLNANSGNRIFSVTIRIRRTHTARRFQSASLGRR